MRRITQLSSVWEASNYADRGIGDISKPPRVVNGQSVGPAAVCGGRQRTQTEELGTSRSHFELFTVTSRLLDISTTRILDYSTFRDPRLNIISGWRSIRLTPAFSTVVILPVSHFPLPHFQSPHLSMCCGMQLICLARVFLTKSSGIKTIPERFGNLSVRKRNFGINLSYSQET